MTTRKKSRQSQPRSQFHRISIMLVLAIGITSQSCTYVPTAGVTEIAHELDDFAKELSTAVREHASTTTATQGTSTKARSGNATEPFADCPQFFVNGKSPVVPPRPTNRVLCYDAFAILHSGESKTAVFVAEKLNRQSIADADEKRTNRFFSDARLRSAERANLNDYKGSDFDKGHMAPAGNMPTAQAMAQSFSLANMVPQAPKHNQVTWKFTVEVPTRKYAERATGDVYVITGPVFKPSIAESPSIGLGQVRVPKYLFKLVYDEDKNRAWAYWQLNDDTTRGSKPISYAELVKRTGINFFPDVTPGN